jgi:uncharacterized protein (TIGR03790 family)
MRSTLAAIALLALAGWASGSPVQIPPTPEAAATIVIYNQTDPQSQALAKYYAGRRGIPADHLLGLACSAKEEISRDEYLVDIRSPLRNAFTAHGWWHVETGEDGQRYVRSASIRFVAVMRGVPLKIQSSTRDAALETHADIQPGTPMALITGQNDACVDSEIAAMFSLSPETAGFIPNPYFQQSVPALTLPPARTPLLVSRLDGPNDTVVRHMIDTAIATEKSGLWGWAYLDERSILSPGYIVGDEWLTSAGSAMRRQGIPVIADYAPEVLPPGFPMTDAAVYYGWYTSDVAGPFALPGFKFLPGAVAVHIHSFSARTLRDPNAAWAGPLLARGAAATMGNVYEPYLELTVHLDILQDRLMNGLTLAEAAYTATPGLSWMNVVLGDPLYRPYQSWSSLTPASEAHPNIWQRYRQIVLDANGDPLQAVPELTRLALDAKMSMPLEALGQAQAAADQFDTALQTLRDAAKIEHSRLIRFRLALERIEILRRAGRKDDALDAIKKELETFDSDAEQTTLGRIALAINPPPPPTPVPTSSPTP